MKMKVIECFHMTSRRPYWRPKTMKRRPCWCSKPILWELNSFLMQTLSFVSVNLHRCWPREWKHSIWFCLQKTISGSYLKQNNSDLVFQTHTIFLKRVRLYLVTWPKCDLSNYELPLSEQKFCTSTSRKLFKRWCGNFYSTSERNYQTFNKIQAKSSFGRHVEGKSMP